MSALDGSLEKLGVGIQGRQGSHIGKELKGLGENLGSNPASGFPHLNGR